MHFSYQNIWQQNFANTRLQPHSQCSSLVVQNSHSANDECCGSLATRLLVGPLSSVMQRSLPSGWPRSSTGKATMQVGSIALEINFASGVSTCRDSCSIQAPSPCHRAPQFLVIMYLSIRTVLVFCVYMYKSQQSRCICFSTLQHTDSNTKVSDRVCLKCQNLCHKFTSS